MHRRGRREGRKEEARRRWPRKMTGQSSDRPTDRPTERALGCSIACVHSSSTTESHENGSEPLPHNRVDVLLLKSYQRREDKLGTPYQNGF